MVILHYKKTDHDQFLYETPKDTPIQSLLNILVNINNLRIKIDVMACAVEDLATHGPLKPEEIRGLSQPQLIQNALQQSLIRVISSAQKKQWAHKKGPKQDQRFNEDQTHYRTGVIKNQQITKMMIETTTKAKKLISYKCVQLKQFTSIKCTNLQKELEEAIKEMQGAVMIAYPGFHGLGQWQTARTIIQNQFEWIDKNTNVIDYLDHQKTSLWWAGKQLLKGKVLADYTGKNQKTKIVNFNYQIVKMSKVGSGCPMREPAIDESTKIKMMSYYHKQQQEIKKLKQDNDDNYLGAEWANSNSLKNHLVGGGKQIKWK